MLNKMELLNGIFNGMNMSPIPLEFSQEMSTTKQLMAMLSKIDEVITFTNGWYEKIIQDLENDGILYEKLSGEILKAINEQLTIINDNLKILNGLTDKISLYINETIPPVSERKEHTLYMKVTQSMDVENNSSVQVTPTMGIKLV